MEKKSLPLRLCALMALSSLLMIEPLFELYGSADQRSSKVKSRLQSVNHVIYNDSNNTNFTEHWLKRIHNEVPRIYYIHVGKTGGIALESGVPLKLGSTIASLKCMVNKTDMNNGSLSTNAMNICSRKDTPSSELDRHIIAHKHMFSARYSARMLDWVLEHLNTILITTRNPVDRINSAFNFHRDLFVRGKERTFSINEAFYNCFGDVRDLANALAGLFGLSSEHHDTIKIFDRSSNYSLPNKRQQRIQNLTCVQLAYHVLENNSFWGHFAYNYQFYRKVSIDRRPDAPILIIRAEHLWDDASKIESSLGGSPASFKNIYSNMSHGSEKFEVTSKLEEGIQKHAICCAIYNDLQAYQDIVESAINLSEDEKNDMIQLVWDDCGVNWSERDIDSHRDQDFWEVWFRQSCSKSK